LPETAKQDHRQRQSDSRAGQQWKRQRPHAELATNERRALVIQGLLSE
jgi:hypothetical protein